MVHGGAAGAFAGYGVTSILFQMDVIHGLTLSEIHPDAVTTAYGPLADFLTIAKSEAARG